MTRELSRSRCEQPRSAHVPVTSRPVLSFFHGVGVETAVASQMNICVTKEADHANWVDRHDVIDGGTSAMAPARQGRIRECECGDID